MLKPTEHLRLGFLLSPGSSCPSLHAGLTVSEALGDAARFLVRSSRSQAIRRSSRRLSAAAFRPAAMRLALRCFALMYVALVVSSLARCSCAAALSLRLVSTLSSLLRRLSARSLCALSRFDALEPVAT